MRQALRSIRRRRQVIDEPARAGDRHPRQAAGPIEATSGLDAIAAAKAGQPLKGVMREVSDEFPIIPEWENMPPVGKEIL